MPPAATAARPRSSRNRKHLEPEVLVRVVRPHVDVDDDLLAVADPLRVAVGDQPPGRVAPPVGLDHRVAQVGRHLLLGDVGMADDGRVAEDEEVEEVGQVGRPEPDRGRAARAGRAGGWRRHEPRGCHPRPGAGSTGFRERETWVKMGKDGAMTEPRVPSATDADRRGRPARRGGRPRRHGGRVVRHVQEGDEERSITDLVDQPAKVMRIGSMIKQLLEEVRASSLDEASRVRLKEIHTRSIRELEEGLAPELVAGAGADLAAVHRRRDPQRGRAAGRAGPAGRLARGALPRHPDRAVRPADAGPRAVRGDPPPRAAGRPVDAGRTRRPGRPGGPRPATTEPGPPAPASTSRRPAARVRLRPPAAPPAPRGRLRAPSS